MGEVGIDSRYVLQDSAEFTLKQESSWRHIGGWSISDGDGNMVFRTESRFMKSHQRTRLLDGTGNPVVCFEEKHPASEEVFYCFVVQQNPFFVRSIMAMDFNHKRTWNVFSGSSEVVLFSLKNSRVFHSKTYMEVFLPSNSDKKSPDYKIRSPEMFSSTFSILHGTQEVAVVKRTTKLFGSTTFTVTVFPGTNHVFIFTLIIIAELKRASDARRESSRR